MMRSLFLFLCPFLMGIWTAGRAQSTPVSNFFPEIKVLESNDPAPGYYFLAAKGTSAPGAQLYIAIVDNYGTPVFFRVMPKASVSMRLLNDGTIGYAHGVPRLLYLLDTMLNVTDTINTVGARLDAHDWDIDDEGDYHRFVFAQYTRTVDMSQLVEGGNPAAEIGEALIQEFDADNQLLNEWRTEELFEILDGNEASPFVDFTEQSIDYAHLNGIEIYTDTSFLLSTRHMDEITCVDRRTGEILWRLGGKNNEFIFLDDPRGFSHQHCPRILENGNLLLFDNGNLHDPQFSSAVEYELDVASRTAKPVKRFRRVPDAFAPRDGSVQRLANGNTIITWGPAWPSMTEFHPDGTVALEFDMTEHSLSPRIEKYVWSTRVFESSLDSVDFGTYDGPDPVEVTIRLVNHTDSAMHITGVSGRTGHFTTVTPLPLAMEPGIETDLVLSFRPQDSGIGYLRDVLTISSDNASQRIARQVYVQGRQQDVVAPGLVIMPDSSNVPVDAVVTLMFTEPVRRSDGSELAHGNLSGTIELRRGDPDGGIVPCRAVVTTDRTRITLFPDTLLNTGETYHVVLADLLEDYSGNAVTTTSGSFHTIAGTAVEGHGSGDKVLVYPNPSRSAFRIGIGSSVQLNLQVHASTGALVWSSSSFDPDGDLIDLNGHPAGLYFLTIRTPDGKVGGRTKLVKVD